MEIEIALTIAMKMSDMDVWIASVVPMNSDASREFAVAIIPSALAWEKSAMVIRVVLGLRMNRPR